MRKEIEVNDAANIVSQSFEKGDSVIVHRYSGFNSQPRHLRVYHDGEAYVRTGKRGSRKLYLNQMARAVIDDGIEKPVFYE